MNYEHLHELAGLQFMPVKANKMPIIKGWQTAGEKHSLSNCEGVGLVCGRLSGGLEIIDVDSKYDLTGKMFDRYKNLIHSVDENLLKKLVVQKTINGGFHIIYRCSKIEGNLKLANRRTTQEEKNKTYLDTYQFELSKSTDDDKAKKIAQKASENDKVRVLFETRGEGGYVMCYPSKGYEIIFGDYYGINEITVDEREVLHSIARQFNEVVDEQIPVNDKRKTKQNGKSPFEDYNERGDVVGLLAEHGWRVVGKKGQKTVFLRPGQTTSATSGNFDHEKNWFSVFTTSTEFQPTTAYLPYAVYTLLECNGDYSAASKKLSELGYGEKEMPKEAAPSTRKIPSRVVVDDNDNSCFAKPEDYDGYLQSVRDGTLVMGKTTGIPSLDEHFLFKQGNLVMNNGIDNTGKSVWSWYLKMLAAMYHGWRGIILSSENTLGAFMRKMIQFYWGKQLHGKFAMNQKEFEVAKAFVENHFLLIKAEEELFNYKDVINMVKKGRNMGNYNYAMIDPYNSLKIDLSGFSKLNTHEYHYEAISELKSFGQKNSFGWWVNLHAVTNAARAKDAEKKYPLPPHRGDTEGGQKFPNKADDFMTTHRLTQHPTEWMITEVHIGKIKETDTGGKPTPRDSPVKMEMYKGQTAFKERNELSMINIDPVEEWHIKRGEVIQRTFADQVSDPQKVSNWMPYKDKDDNEVGF